MKAALLVALLVLASAARGQDVPALTGRVVDTAEILSPAVEAALVERLAAFEDSTTTQVVVLTVPSLGGAVLEEFATRVFRAWRIGQEGRDNGALLLVARDDRKVRIEVGYGLEGDLTDARSATIIRADIVPRFRDGDYDAGVLAGVEAIVGSIEGSYEPTSLADLPGNGAENPWAAVLIALLVFGLIPMGIGFHNRNMGVLGRYLTLLVTWFVVVPFAGSLMSPGLPQPWGLWLGMAVLLGYPVGFVLLDLWLSRSTRGRELRGHARRTKAAVWDAQARGATSVVVDGVSYSVPVRSSSSYSSGSRSSSGGFSGGGGSSGGGGASGRW